jgi:hypothetical protein
VGRPDQTDAARRFISRFVSVAAVVAGLLVLIAPLCGDGMAMMPSIGIASTTDSIGPVHHEGPTAASSTSPCDPMIVGAASSRAHCASDATGRWSVPFESSVPSGVLLACVGFVIAILAAALALRPPQSRRPHAIQRAVEPPTFLLCPARPPTLAELCVLRT